MKLSALQLTKSICMMVYGAPKMGKSHFAASACATCPDGKVWLVVSSLNGLSTYKGAEVKKAFPGLDENKIELLLIERDRDLKNVNAWDNFNKSLKEWVDKRSSEIAGIIFDDSTFLRMQARNVAIKVNGQANRSGTLDKANGSFNGQTILEQSDFGREMEMMTNLLDEVTFYGRKNNFHVLVLCHEKVFEKETKKSEQTGIPRESLITAAFTGSKERSTNTGFFDITARVFRKSAGEGSTKVYFRCKSDGLVDAGDRFGVLLSIEENLTWQKVMDKVAKQEAAVEPVREKKESIQSTNNSKENGTL